jgi:hypothetical protein
MVFKQEKLSETLHRSVSLPDIKGIWHARESVWLTEASIKGLKSRTGNNFKLFTDDLAFFAE